MPPRMDHPLRSALPALLLLCAASTMLAQSPRTNGHRDTTSLDLHGLVAFRPGDDDTWRSRYIDEGESWNFIPVPGQWERHGFPLLDGFAWYRIRFTLPASMREDSLLLIMSGVDDADETYLNGLLVGRTGAFPPAPRSEPRSLRVYPLPRFVREEHNLIAVRVYDRGDDGGILGPILRIVRADSILRVLDEVVDEPFHAPALFISGGDMCSSIDPDSALLRWCRPHLSGEYAPGLHTERILSSLTITTGSDGHQQPFAALPAEGGGYAAPGVAHLRRGGIDLFLYHPPGPQHILVAAVCQREDDSRTCGLGLVLDRPYWAYREAAERADGQRITYHILAHHTCCDELAQRDLENFMGSAPATEAPAYVLSRAVRGGAAVAASLDYLPASLSPDEQRVYRSCAWGLLSLQSREEGSGGGQIVAALDPASRALSVPGPHLDAAAALAEAGLTVQAARAIAFADHAPTGAWTFFQLDGIEYGVGHPHIVTPAQWYGSGEEYRWARLDDAVLRHDGPAAYIEAIDALRRAEKRAAVAGFDDSTWLARRWDRLARLAADVLRFRRDSTGLVPTDASPWGPGLSSTSGIIASIHAAAALRIAADAARTLGFELQALLYERASEETAVRLRAMASAASLSRDAAQLAGGGERIFHPLLCDAVTTGVFVPDSKEALFALRMPELAFAVDSGEARFSAAPDGDWYARQSRPLIALHLAAAHATAGSLARADTLFALVTRLALRGGGMLPELVDPVSGNWYGAQPSAPTMAAYIRAAERIALRRMQERARPR
jgi:hypothetical protein